MVSLSLKCKFLTEIQKAEDAGYVSPEFAAKYRRLVEYVAAHGKLPAKRTKGYEDLGRWMERLRAKYRELGAAMDQTVVRLLEMIPEWEWERRTGTHPDDQNWMRQLTRAQTHYTEHGELPTWDSDRELYDWLRGQHIAGPEKVGETRAAILEAQPWFTWETPPDGRRQPRRKKTAPARAVAGPSVPQSAYESALTPDPNQDPAYAADPQGWCHTQVAALFLRDDCLTLQTVSDWAGVSHVAVHQWLREATGTGGVLEWRRQNGWLGQTMPPGKAAWILAQRAQFPNEPVKAFANLLGLPLRQVRLALDAADRLSDRAA